MLNVDKVYTVYLACGVTDLRKSIQDSIATSLIGLVILVITCIVTYLLSSKETKAILYILKL